MSAGWDLLVVAQNSGRNLALILWCFFTIDAFITPDYSDLKLNHPQWPQIKPMQKMAENRFNFK